MTTETLQKDSLLRGGQFLVKETKCEDIFTLEDLNEEQKMMRESTKEFADRELWAHWERFEKKDYAYTEECMRKAGELGLLSIAVPEEYGGMGMGFVSTMLVCDYISGVTGSFSTAFGAHTGIGTMPITLYGTEEQKKKYVPKLASGEWFGAYCLHRTGRGIRCQFRKDQGGIIGRRKTLFDHGAKDVDIKCRFLQPVHSVCPPSKMTRTSPDS